MSWLGSLPMRGAWIEIVSELNTRSEAKSLPMRGAWIEIFEFHPDSDV